nr:hypothetical protein [Microctonus hyperodae filamentous virus]
MWLSILCFFLYIFYLYLPILYLHVKEKNIDEETTTNNTLTKQELLQNIASHVTMEEELVAAESITPKMCMTGLLVNKKKEKYVNCNKVCNNVDGGGGGGATIQFEYKWYGDDVGGFCVPQNMVRCNHHLNDLIFVRGEYKCVPKYPELFGGIYGNEIVGCNGSIVVEAKEYNHYVPFDFEEDIKKIKCKMSLSNLLNNPPVRNVTDFGEYFLTSNVCTSLIYQAPVDTLLPNFPLGICGSGGDDDGNFKHLFNDEKMPFTMCQSGWQRGGIGINQGAAYGMGIARPCITSETPEFLWPLLKFPCSSYALKSKSFCEQGVLQATTTYSPLALETINSQS